MPPAANPYNWQHHDPRAEIPRRLVEPLVDELLQGGGAVVVGGRGMGKSVLLHQVRAALESCDGVRVLYFPAPPQELSAPACLAALAKRLGQPVGDAESCYELFESYFERPDSSQRVVLLYDEFDRYARRPAGEGGATAGRDFFNDLETARRAWPRIGVLAVGTLGVFVFRDVLGSSFLSRAARFWLSPFDHEEARQLARPFAERGSVLDDEVHDALWLMSGGHPALLTYGLQQLWEVEDPGEHDVAAIYARFREHYGEFLADVEQAFSDPSLSRIPQRVWQIVREHRGPLPRERLERLCRSGDGVLRLGVAEVLQLLQAAGLVEIDGSPISDDPLLVRPRSSLLALPEISPPAPDLARRLWSDLERLLGSLFAASADFFRPGSRAGEKTLVPESVFSAFLALGFGLLGWTVEREAQQARGRTDLKLRRNGAPEHSIVEVKIWSRPGAEQVLEQIGSYWTPETSSGAVVMLTDADIPSWPAAYRQCCLGGPSVQVEEVVPEGGSALAGRFRSTSPTPAGTDARVEHFLVRLPR